MFALLGRVRFPGRWELRSNAGVGRAFVVERGAVMKRGGFVTMVLAALVMSAVAIAVSAVAINVSTGGSALWFPSMDEFYPWWLAGSILTMSGSALWVWWGQRRYEQALSGLVPVPQRNESWVVERPLEVDRVVRSLL